MSDREKLLGFSAGQRVEVWMAPYPLPTVTRIAGVAAGLSLKDVEVLLDSRYAPLFGRPLGARLLWDELDTN